MDKKKVDVSMHLKKVQLLNPSLPLSQQGGFKCGLCQASFKSHDSYLDHINSRVHLLNSGVDKRVFKQANIDSVKNKLKEMKSQKEAAKLPKRSALEIMEERISDSILQEKLEKEKKHQKKKAAKRRKVAEATE